MRKQTRMKDKLALRQERAEFHRKIALESRIAANADRGVVNLKRTIYELKQRIDKCKAELRVEYRDSYNRHLEFAMRRHMMQHKEAKHAGT